MLAHMKFILSQAFNFIFKRDRFVVCGLFFLMLLSLSYNYFSFHNIDFSSSGTGASSYEGLSLHLLLILFSIAQTAEYCLRYSISLKIFLISLV